MQPSPAGSRVRIVKNCNDHSYTIGRTYKVHYVDDDGTFRAIGSDGKVGDWLRWGDCGPAGQAPWDRIAAELPDDLVAFLSCFDGIASLQLKESVIDEILAGLPDVHERILAFAKSDAGRGVIACNAPQGMADAPETEKDTDE